MHCCINSNGEEFAPFKMCLINSYIISLSGILACIIWKQNEETIKEASWVNIGKAWRELQSLKLSWKFLIRWNRSQHLYFPFNYVLCCEKSDCFAWWSCVIMVTECRMQWGWCVCSTWFILRVSLHSKLKDNRPLTWTCSRWILTVHAHQCFLCI